MPLFKCTTCHHVENTALSNYWVAVHVDKSPALCSLCDPGIGVWHDGFPRKPACGMLVDDAGFLWSREELDAGVVPTSLRLIAQVSDSGSIEPIEPTRPSMAPTPVLGAHGEPGMSPSAGRSPHVGKRPWSQKSQKSQKCEKNPKRKPR